MRGASGHFRVVHPSKCGDTLQRLASGLDSVAALYETYERSMTTPSIGQNVTSEENTGASWLDDVLETTTSGIDWLLERLSENCGAFAILSMLFDFSEGELVEGVTSKTRIGSSFFGAFADTAADADWFEDFMGLNQSGIHDLSEAYDRFLDDVGLGDAPRTGAGTAAAVCRWAGYALTFLQSGVDNYEEFDGDMSNARFWGETVIEGVVDVGVGIGVGILAAAVLPATWPAVVVGAVGSVAVWGIDAIFEYCTNGESDLSDAVANVICDGVSAVVDTVQDIGRSIVDGANAFCDWVGSWW